MGRALGQFRKNVIRRSLFPKTNLSGALKRMGFVQADPIRCPARAQDLILRHRVKNYRAGKLESLYPELPLEEFFLFAYGIGAEKLWEVIHPRGRGRLSDFEKVVLATVQEYGEMHPRALNKIMRGGRTENAWGGSSGTTRLALEPLHDRGVLRVKRRENGIRIYEVARDS